MLQIKETFNSQDVSSSLYSILNLVDKLSKIDSKYHKHSEILNDVYYNVEDLESTIKDDFNHLEFDEDHLNDINERISYLNSLSRKYKTDVVGLIKLKEELKQKIDNVDNIDIYIKMITKMLEDDYAYILYLMLMI